MENVKVIEPLIPYTAIIGRHFIWSNLSLYNKKFPKLFKVETYIGSDGKKHNGGLSDLTIGELLKLHKIEDFYHPKKRSILRNCVDYRVGEYILKAIAKQTSLEAFLK